jgi:hypothetical protein
MENRNEQPHALSFLPRAGNREIFMRAPRLLPPERSEKEMPHE